jgi:preprotein translocase subunit YajC
VGGYIFIIVILILMWFLLIRPQRRRQVESQRLLDSLAVGQEIVTAGGLYGTITALDDDEARVQIADGVEVRVAKRAIAGVLSAEEEEGPSELTEPEESPGTLP